MKRALRSQGVRSLLVGLGGAIAVLLLGALHYELTAVWLVGAGVGALFLGILTWLALEPNAPHDPQAGREDRGYNYVRGEGGGGA